MNYEWYYGYFWSASPSSAPYGYYLYFSSSYAYPQDSSQRGYGFPVRCVQE